MSAFQALGRQCPHPLARVVSALLFAVLLASCAVMPRTVPISAVTPAQKAGIIYSLPRTLVQVALPLKQSKRSPGDLLPTQGDWTNYAEYLRRELGIEPHEIILQEYTAYSVVDGSTIGTSAVPDQDATFYVETEAGGLEELKVDLTFGARGVLTKADVASTHHGLPLVGKIGESVVGLSTVGAFTFNPGSALQAIVAEIKTVRKSRDDALAKAAFDADVVRMYLEQLQARETKLLARLIGREETKLWTLQAEVDPRPTPAMVYPHSEIIIRLHDGAGVEITNGINRQLCPFPSATAPIATAPNEFEKNGPAVQPNWKAITPITTTIAFALALKAIPFNAASLPATGDGSLYYRIPADASASLTLSGRNTKSLAIQDLVIAQLGVIRQLPRKLGGVSGGYVITLDEATGALKSISTTSKPFDAGGQVTALANKFIEKEKVDEELTALERKKKKLEFEAAIRDLEKKAEVAEGEL